MARPRGKYITSATSYWTELSQRSPEKSPSSMSWKRKRRCSPWSPSVVSAHQQSDYKKVFGGDYYCITSLDYHYLKKKRKGMQHLKLTVVIASVLDCIFSPVQGWPSNHFSIPQQRVKPPGLNGYVLYSHWPLRQALWIWVVLVLITSIYLGILMKPSFTFISEFPFCGNIWIVCSLCTAVFFPECVTGFTKRTLRVTVHDYSF